MSMMFCVDAKQLRRALAEVEAAEKNGFMHCLAVFKMAQAGPMLSDCLADYSDLLERAHPTSGAFDWGRFQAVSQRHRFDNKTMKLVPLASPSLRSNAKPAKKARR